MKTKLTLFVAAIAANCLFAVELPEGIKKDSKDPLVQAYIKYKGDIVEAIKAANPTATADSASPATKCDNKGQLVAVNLNDLKKLTDDSMILLKQVPTIKSLAIGATPITEKGLKHISEIQSLEHLHLGSCFNLNGKSLEVLNKLNNLSNLTAYNLNFTDSELKALSSLDNLTEIDITNSPKVTLDGVRQLAAIKKLSLVNIQYCPKVEKHVSTLRAEFPKIRFHTLKEYK